MEGLLEVRKDVFDSPVFFLHLLMMAPALVSRSSCNDLCHLLKDFSGSSPLFVLKMGREVLYKLQIEDLLVKIPSSNLRFREGVFAPVALEIIVGEQVILRGRHGGHGEIILGVKRGERLNNCICLHWGNIIEI